MVGIILIPVSVLLPYIPVFRFLKTPDFWYVQYIALLTVLLSGISAYLWRFSKPLSYLTALGLFSAIAVTKQSPLSIMLCIQLYLCALAIWGISRANEQQRAGIRWTIIIIAWIYCGLVLLQYFNIDPFFTKLDEFGKPLIGHTDTVGLSGSHNMAGVFFSVVGVSLINIFPMLLPLMVFGLWVSQSTFAVIGFICGSLSLLATKRKPMRVIVLILLAVSVFFFKFEKGLSKAAISARTTSSVVAIKSLVKGNIEIKKDNTRKVISTNPILGYGLGNFAAIFPYYQDKTLSFNGLTQKFVHLHNDYLEFIFEFGYIGLLFLVWILIDFIRKVRLMWSNREAMTYAAAVISYLVCAIGLFPSHTAVGGMWLILFYGLFLSVYREWEIHG